MNSSSEGAAVDSGEWWGPEGKRQKNLEIRPHSDFVCEGAWTHQGPIGRRWNDARQGGLLELVTKQIEVIGIGADLKHPGSAAALVGGIGKHGGHKDREGQYQDQDSQRFHFKPAPYGYLSYETNDPVNRIDRDRETH
jgi:hypothetical protein